jgi:hypothetical protein
LGSIYKGVLLNLKKSSNFRIFEIWVFFRNVYLICLSLWLFAIPVAAFDQILQSNLIYKPSPTLLVTQYSTYAAGGVYAALGCRMIWMKCKKIENIKFGLPSHVEKLDTTSLLSGFISTFITLKQYFALRANA